VTYAPLPDQVKWDSDPPLPLRFLDYWVRLYRLYRVPITQVLVLLRPPAEGTEIESAFVLGTTRHEFMVLELWEQDPELFLDNPVLLPFAPLTLGMTSAESLSQVAQEVAKIESRTQRKEISAYTQLMAGLRFNKKLIYQVFQEGMMRESVIYQDILQQGEQKGRQEGRQEEGVSLVLRLITRRFGTIPPSIDTQLRSLPLPQLEDLGEALFDFSEVSDLEDWLRSHS
jgi:predicted transposase YdaD